MSNHFYDKYYGQGFIRLDCLISFWIGVLVKSCRLVGQKNVLKWAKHENMVFTVSGKVCLMVCTNITGLSEMYYFYWVKYVNADM